MIKVELKRRMFMVFIVLRFFLENFKTFILIPFTPNYLPPIPLSHSAIYMSQLHVLCCVCVPQFDKASKERGAFSFLWVRVPTGSDVNTP